MKYTFIFHSFANGYYATCHDLPGLVIAGRSIEQIGSLIPKAVKVHCTSLNDKGIPSPEPTTFAKTYEVTP